jgi:hypothetical protein
MDTTSNTHVHSDLHLDDGHSEADADLAYRSSMSHYKYWCMGLKLTLAFVAVTLASAAITYKVVWVRLDVRASSNHHPIKTATAVESEITNIELAPPYGTTRAVLLYGEHEHVPMTGDLRVDTTNNEILKIPSERLAWTLKDPAPGVIIAAQKKAKTG